MSARAVPSPTATLGPRSAVSVHASETRSCIRNACIRYRTHTLACARHFKICTSHSFLSLWVLFGFVAREGRVRGAVHASAPSRKSPTELEDHAGGPAANAEG